MEFVQDFFILLGRICIGSVFLWSSYGRLKNWSATLAYMKAKGIPQLSIVLPTSLVLKTIGSLLILFGWMTSLGALLLLVVLVPSAMKLHPFWLVKHGNERAMEQLFFMKDIAVIGGLLILLAVGGGHFGVSGV